MILGCYDFRILRLRFNRSAAVNIFKIIYYECFVINVSVEIYNLSACFRIISSDNFLFLFKISLALDLHRESIQVFLRPENNPVLFLSYSECIPIQRIQRI